MKYSYILQDSILPPAEKEYFDYIKADMTDSVAAMSLHRLSICLNRYYGKKVIILLDEYDTPLQEAYVGGYWEQMVQFTSNRESGFGRYDVMLKPLKDGNPAFVLEFKVHDPDEETSLADTVKAALKQIEEKAYDTELMPGGFPGSGYGIMGFPLRVRKC